MSPYEALIRAVPVARRSPMIAPMAVRRPWLRLVGFLALSCLFLVGAILAIAILAVAAPGLADLMQMSGALPDRPSRLLDESLMLAALAISLFAIALAVLGAAAMIYGMPMSAFLWPGRRFNAWDLGAGFLTMVCLSAILFPVYLWTGGEWAPPIFDPLYVHWTRPVFLLASIVGLLIAAAGEEVLCRGVLLRLTTQISRHPVYLCVINGVVFSALHLDPDPVGFVARALSGAVWTWAAIRLGGIEFAIGAHLANNLMITLFWQPLSAMEIGRESAWIELAPELFVAAVMVIMIERLADGPRDWRPAGLAPRRTA